ncbi:MAG: class I adenylate-forming enzyme family protein [Acidimicrobiaceae bacterium]|nr:class I adenylate-forming enzyme family protein [Acidimicrobiaceae bacterium]
MRNLAELVCDRVRRRPDARFGMAGDTTPTLEQAAGPAMAAAGALEAAGAGFGRRVALIGTTSDSYLTAWLALVLAGAETAMVNPDYPDELLAEMLAQLAPDAVVWVGREVSAEVAPNAVHLDGSSLAQGLLRRGTAPRSEIQLGSGLTGLAGAPGLARDRFDAAGWMHTSGTTGVPKFCEQTHEYFLRLGRFIADSMCFSETDTVLAPLPMFHINPLGYGVIGGLTGGVDVLGLERFSARGFWPLVRACGATVLILHAPPVEILKRATTAEDAAGHRVSRMFFADPDFLETFGVPLGFSAYGSTEAGGLCHIWAWRRGDRPELAEGMSRYGGRARHEVQWRIDDGGEIHVRADREGVLFSGYRRADGLLRPFDEDGWFATGDLGRTDEAGNLVFIERRSESIRVKGEFVPIGYVEQRFASVDGIDDVAVWRRDSDLVDDEIVLYMTGESIPTGAILATSADLPGFMRPTTVARVGDIPRDSGVGKVRRRLLGGVAVLEQADLGARRETRS